MSLRHLENPDLLFERLEKQPVRDETGCRIWQTIGNTPLLRLEALDRSSPPGVRIYAKAEWFNPGGSIKDRPALNMILEAERSGDLTRQKGILDASSGNTALAYAMIGAARGYRVTLCVPQNVSDELLKALRAYGAEVVVTEPGEGSDGAIRKARELHRKHPERYFYIDQYNNPANWQAHYQTTGVEIWRQTRGEITHFVAGLGTSGTFMGTGRRLKEYNQDIQLVSLQPDSPLHGLEGLKHMETAIVPGIFDPDLGDAALTVSTEEAQRMVKRLARKEGVFIGLSSGAAAAAALRVAQSIRSGVVVTIFPDGGRRYIHENFWEEE